MNIKVLLIYPPNEHITIYSKNKKNIQSSETCYYPPLGLMYLSAALKFSNFNNIKILDLSLKRTNGDKIAEEIAEYLPDVVGITAYTVLFYDVLRVCKIIKKINPDIFIILGGPHIDIFPEETIKHSAIDAICFGDGEETICEIVKNLSETKSLNGIKGIWFKSHDEIIKNNKRTINKELNFPFFPDYSDIDLNNTFNPFFKSSKVATISSSRGCPYHCTFCDMLDKFYRMRSVENILDEIEYLKKSFGIENFFFVDDLFNINEERVLNFSENVLKRNLKINWILRGRINKLSEKSLSLAKAAGCIHIIFGIEEWSDEGFKIINKKITKHQIISVFNILHKLKIETTTNFIIGFPHHTKSYIEELYKTLRKLKPDYIQLSILVPFPGSKIYDEAVKLKIINENLWEHYIENPTDLFEMPLWLEHFTLDEIMEVYNETYKKFYFNIAYSIRKILKIASFSELQQKFKVALNMLKSIR